MTSNKYSKDVWWGYIKIPTQPQSGNMGFVVFMISYSENQVR